MHPRRALERPIQSIGARGPIGGPRGPAGGPGVPKKGPGKWLTKVVEDPQNLTRALRPRIYIKGCVCPLVGQSVGWSISQLVGRSDSWLDSWSVGPSVRRSVSLSPDR